VIEEVSEAEVAKHRFTVEEFRKMGEAGIFGEDDRVELVEGEILEMTPIGWLHVESVNALAGMLAGPSGDRTLHGERAEPARPRRARRALPGPRPLPGGGPRPGAGGEGHPGCGRGGRH
jgi:hypothetical protein